MKKLSIIMPALNEECNISEAISDSLKTLDEFNIDGEIIAINDGSRDGTFDLMNELASRNKDRVLLVEHKEPKGVGSCFWEGIGIARGELIVMLPGDNENDPREILRYVKILDDVDIIVPFVYNKNMRSFLRNFLSYIYRSIINITFNTFFNYTNGTILYRKSILKDVDSRCRSFFYNTDTLIRLVRKGYLFAEVPYRLRGRSRGKSKAIKFSSFLQVGMDYLRLIRDVYFKRKAGIKSFTFSRDSISFKRFNMDI